MTGAQFHPLSELTPEELGGPDTPPKPNGASKVGAPIAPNSGPATEITVLTKTGGPLTKRISLSADGAIKSDGSACVMTSGRAHRVPITDAGELAAVIQGLAPNQAIALGRLRPELADEVQIVTKNSLNGKTAPNVIARTADNFVFQPNQPAWALLDHDRKGMPPHVMAEIERRGGFWGAIVDVVPALENTARVERASTSAGLNRADTGEQFPGSGGQHAYVASKDGADIERFLRTLHDRCWLAGLGWYMIGVSGHLLERSIIDRSVGAPERLVFEGDPVLKPPIAQDPESRRPIAVDGDVLDTLEACHALTSAEQEKLADLKAEAKKRLGPEVQRIKAELVVKLMNEKGWSVDRAKRTVEMQDGGILLSDQPLIFDDLGMVCVRDVLANPTLFIGEALSDPIEGPSYGRGKAHVFENYNNDLVVRSFAHGGQVFTLRADPVEEFEAILVEGGLGGVNAQTVDPVDIPPDKAERQVAPVFDPWDAYVVPAFPLDIFPDVIRQFVETQSHVIGCDPTAVAMSVLGALSAALDHRFKLKMLRNGDWFASPRLWVLLVGDPSRKKTPAINAAVRALERREQAAREFWESERPKAKALMGDDFELPRPARYVINDVTIEKLAEILSRQDRGTLVKRDEISGWVGSMERYSGRSAKGASADRAFWLQAYDGGPYVVDRVGRGEIRIRNLSVSFIGGVQPERLSELHGLTSDGLLQRFLPVMIGPASFPTDIPTRDASNAFQALMLDLVAAAPSTVTLTDAAYDAATALRRRLYELEQVGGGLAQGFQGFVGKLAGMFGSVALILHMARNPQQGGEMPVDVRTVEDAARFVMDFALPHAFEFYRTAETVTDGDRLQKIASYILTAGKQRLLVSDLTRNIPMLRGLGMWDVNKLVSPFVAGGWLSPCDQGPVSRSWRVEAAVFDQFKARAQDEERRKEALAELMNSPRGKGGL